MNSYEHPVIGSHRSLVHGLLSSQYVVVALFWQPATGSQTSSVQKFPSLQSRMVEPGTHTPLTQVSPMVQTLLSLQGPGLLE